MSYMEVYAIRPNGDVERYGEAHNAWGGAMHIWVKLGEKYHIPIRFAAEDGFKLLWNSIGKMAEADQWVMASTFDRCLISKEYLPTLIHYWKSFAAIYPTSTMTEGITILEKAESDEQVQGIGFNHTSVSQPFWFVYPDNEEEEEEERPYNINQDTGHWFLTPDTVRSQDD